MFDENCEKLQKTIKTEKWQDLQTLEFEINFSGKEHILFLIKQTQKCKNQENAINESLFQNDKNTLQCALAGNDISMRTL